MEVCTIIAKNYVAHARVLARSLAEQNPGSRLWTLIVDEYDGYIDPAQEPFEVLTPRDVGCEPFDFMALRYTVLELSTAVKPWLLRDLMGRTGQPVTYLDPDIRVYGSLQRLDDLAAEHGVVAIPHNNVPLPPDGRKPTQVDVMIAGVYNLGYVSLSARPEVERLLDWWADRLRRDCRVDPVWGYFVDQRWFDLVPGFLTDFAIVREPEYNVAYWNLHSRRLEQDGERYLVDGHPLAFFHFSGFDPQQPLALSRHQNRIDVTADPVLERLLADYAREVMGEGHAVSRRWPYSYTTLGDGTEIDDLVRELCEEFEEQLENDGAGDVSPFTAAGARTFQDWLGQDVPDGSPGVSRLLAHVYSTRADLQRSFPDLSGPDRERLLGWAEEIGVDEVPLLARNAALGRGADHKSSAPTLSSPLAEGPWGINLVGPYGSQDELGEVARQIVQGLDAGGVPVVPVQEISRPQPSGSEAFEAVMPEEAPYLVNLLCAPSSAVPEIAAAAGHRFFAGRYSIGLLLDERAPDPTEAEVLQEIWVPSRYIASALAGSSPVPMMVVPLPVQPPPFLPRSRRELGLPEDIWLFLTILERQSQDCGALIEAFRQAFPSDEPVGLAVICADSGAALEDIRSAADADSRIRVLDGPEQRPERLALTALCDCYVSLHSAEPFGMAIAEAMWLARPVIATGYSGNLEFMSESNGLLVQYQLQEGQARPDVAHAAQLMREVAGDRLAASALGERAATDIRATHSPARSGAVMASRLESIRSTGRVPRWLRRHTNRPAALGNASGRIEAGPPSSARIGPGHRLRSALRSMLLRALKPYTSYQHRVNLALVEALEEAHHLSGPEQPNLERAQLLTELRGARQLRTALETQARAVDELRRIITLQADRGLFLALSELARRHARIGPGQGEPPASVALSGYELRAYSQNGEDGVLAEILRRIGAPARFFVEFGVESGVEGNCVYLADVAGWQGLFMEADENMYRWLERKYSPRPAIRTIEARASPDNIEALLAAGEVPSEPDVVSIDVDGQDYWIWEAIERYRPRVVIVEYNSALDPRRRLVQPPDASGWDGTDYFGASLGALRSLGDRKGYRLVHTELAGSNAFFVRDDLVGEKFLDPAEVPVRGVPNYFQSAYRHPKDDSARRYLDLDTGEMVSSTR